MHVLSYFYNFKSFFFVQEGELLACAQSATLNQKFLNRFSNWFKIHCHSTVSKGLWGAFFAETSIDIQWNGVCGFFYPLGKLPNVLGHLKVLLDSFGPEMKYQDWFYRQSWPDAFGPSEKYRCCRVSRYLPENVIRPSLPLPLKNVGHPKWPVSCLP